MSDIGLPRGMSRDDAYVQGIHDAEQSMLRDEARSLHLYLNDLHEDMTLGVLERSAVRRSINERLLQIEDELA